jgi:hypothetical protein
VASSEDFSKIVKLLNGVQSAGQARAAAGAALKAISPTYDLLDELPDDRARAGKTELTGARVALEEWYRSIEKVSAAAPFNNEWPKGRKLVERAYIVIAGIEAEANHIPQTSNLQILGQSLAEAPAVFTAAVGKVAKETGKVVGTVAKEAGQAAGAAVGGIFSGLGLSGTVTLLLIGLVVLAVLKRGTLVGAILGRLSK